MSTQQHNVDSSLNNLPERNATKPANSETLGSSTGAVASVQGKGGSIPAGTEDTSAQYNTPIDKHGDTWGGGIPGHNNQFR
jgi:hypothetical protein